MQPQHRGFACLVQDNQLVFHQNISGVLLIGVANTPQTSFSFFPSQARIAAQQQIAFQPSRPLCALGPDIASMSPIQEAWQ
jgi:hypothetical protein